MKPILYYKKNISDLNPSLTIVLTTFNQELIVGRVIDSILLCSKMLFELIIIDDSSEDKTLSNVLAKIMNMDLTRSQIVNVSVYRNTISKFETYCDDFGIRQANTNSIIILQSDIVITEQSFDDKLMAVFRYFPDILMVSGRGTESVVPISRFFKRSNGSVVDLGLLTLFMSRRCVPKPMQLLISYVCSLADFAEKRLIHLKFALQSKLGVAKLGVAKLDDTNLDLIFPSQAQFQLTGSAGFLTQHEPPEGIDVNKSAFLWVGQTVMRGPIALDRSKYLEIGGFDLGSCFLGFDDHEIALRAYLRSNYRVGFVPVGYRSSLEWGVTRRPRSMKQSRIAIRNCLRTSKQRKLTPLFNLEQRSISLPDPEIRQLPFRNS